jgi:glycosyltransferase involved in cell wall biosynthesis
MRDAVHRPRRVFFIANGLFGTSIAGGDIHFLHLARGARDAGHEVVFVGPAVTEHVLRREGLDFPVLLTDRHPAGEFRCSGLRAQLTVFGRFLARLVRSRRIVRAIQEHDIAYAVSDYWVDTLPVVWSGAGLKMMILHMRAPSAKDALFSDRPDIAGSRLGSLHYALSQRSSLRRFRVLPAKRILHVHPSSVPYLEDAGFSPSEIVFVPVGLDVAAADRVPDQPKLYDSIWIGRIHRQKGLDDLIEVLRALAHAVPGFRAVLVGDVEDHLRPRIEAAGIGDAVRFAGVVMGEEKFRLIKSSRMMLIPSHYEGWPAVIGEALICGVPVLGYDLPGYRPVTGDLMSYVPPFDLAMLCHKAKEMVVATRGQAIVLAPDGLARFRARMSVAAMRRSFNELLAAHTGAAR